ncbi:MAG: hypothetical protein KKG09_02485 [Verrucomicrobia bacterium]|nr:hypothetical protein [Verrucomicrobiota bacterium]MCG2681516.1 hypothetical protein [Kiritimatiellia bacterium]MBU4247358.1 hypothetical protein [Verrucomicrobiota bacterium]MBU4289977.1 hypothetical protein [Verrucomicrobiota bacterium]MBU4428966.1 hypothetical protein [Verrucomicrobiota bacterium]
MFAEAAGDATSIADVKVELPLLRTPICFIVDDGAPCVNPVYYWARDCDKMPPGTAKPWIHTEAGAGARSNLTPCIPLSFLQEYVAWANAVPHKGKFTVLPIPMGLGRITEGLKGCPKTEVDAWVKQGAPGSLAQESGLKAEVDAWIQLVRDNLPQMYDITPECWTHTLGLDLNSMKTTSEIESDLLSRLSQSDPLTELVEYISGALSALKAAGFDPTGFTNPAWFKGDKKRYGQAIAEAFLKIDGPKVTFIFVDVDQKSPKVLPQTLYVDRSRKLACVNVPASCNEPFAAQAWLGAKIDPSAYADTYLTADGARGRFADLMETGSPIVFFAHWNTLWAEGTQGGLRGVQEIIARVNRVLAKQVVWMKPSEIARWHVAGETCRFKTDGNLATIESLFACENFTVSLGIAGSAVKEPRGVTVNGRPLRKIPYREFALEEGTFTCKDGRVFAGFRLPEGRTELEVAGSE